MILKERFSARFRKAVDACFYASLVFTLLGALLLSANALSVYSRAIETYLSPPVRDFTLREWVRDDETGRWRAVAYLYKARPECLYVRGQPQVFSVFTPAGESVETEFIYVEDPTPGSNRAVGWQRLDDQVELTSANIPGGSVIRGSVLHDCRSDGLPTVSVLGPSVVGQDDSWPTYVSDWIAAGREGTPSDYR